MQGWYWRSLCWRRAFFTRERSQKFKVMKFWNFWSDKCGGFLAANFCQTFPGKIGLNFVTENFTTFFTPRQEICHVQLTLRASSPIQPVEGATKCKGSTEDLYLCWRRAFLHQSGSQKFKVIKFWNFGFPQKRYPTCSFFGRICKCKTRSQSSTTALQVLVLVVSWSIASALTTQIEIGTLFPYTVRIAGNAAAKGEFSSELEERSHNR